MDKNNNNNKRYIITDMELGDNLDNIVFMYHESPLQHNNSMDTKNGEDSKRDEGTK